MKILLLLYLFTGISAEDLINKMSKANAEIKTIKYTFTAAERIDGKVSMATSSVKLNINPRKLYLLGLSAELLWTPTAKSNAVLVKPLTFPYFPMNLDPFSNLMRQGQHHTLYEAGFDYFIKIIQHTLELSHENKNFQLVVTGEETVHNRNCYKLAVINGAFSYVNYTVKANENIHQIAEKMFVSEALILEHNHQCRNFRDVKAGDVILIPNSYSKMSIVFVDKQTFLPISSKIYDESGFFEGYEYDDLNLNCTFQENEFSRNFKGYHF